MSGGPRALQVGALALLVCMAWPDAVLADSLAEALPVDGGRTGSSASRPDHLSADARELLVWLSTSGDHGDAAFFVVDKRRAQLLVFDAGLSLLGTSPILLGAALGDDSVEGIGERPMAEVLAFERTTPAGRFVAEPGRNAQGEDVVWVDYDAAVSMHRVRTGSPTEQRAERLATPTTDDNRISYGCINVPKAFYETFVRPLAARQTMIIYVLPDSKSLRQVFGAL